MKQVLMALLTLTSLASVAQAATLYRACGTVGGQKIVLSNQETTFTVAQGVEINLGNGIVVTAFSSDDQIKTQLKSLQRKSTACVIGEVSITEKDEAMIKVISVEAK